MEEIGFVVEARGLDGISIKIEGGGQTEWVNLVAKNQIWLECMLHSFINTLIHSLIIH